MIDDLKPYPAMKDSGVPWLGEVPEHWKVQTVGRLGQLFKGNGGSKADEVDFGIPCVRYGDLYTRHEFFITKTKACVSPERASAYTPIQFGDLLFAASGETDEDIGRSAVNLLQADARCGGDVLVLRPSREFVPRFLGYAADSHASRAQKATMGRGFTVVHIYGAQLKHLALAIPPLPEQTAIVRFLDYMDRRIRRYIRAKQKLIKLLEEQKQAIIHRAVTRGLDPNVRLKPSGVEWLGDVPEHWEVRRVKSLSLVKRGASPRPIADPKYFDDNGEYAWVRIADVSASSRHLETTTQRLSSLGDSLSVRLEPGALFLSIAGSVGKPIITKIKCCIHDGFVYFPRFRGNAEFLCRVFSCGAPFHRLGKLGTQLNLNTDTVGGICVGWPPADEQAAIVAYLDEATASSERACASTRREIALLREYRTRLIADVVTGKLDVREAAARLPQEAEDTEPLDEVEDDTEESGAGENDDVSEEEAEA